MAYRISQPLAVTQFDNGDKKKPKKKKGLTSNQQMMLDVSPGGPRKTRTPKTKVAKTMTAYEKKKAAEKQQRKVEKEGRKSFRGHDLKMKMTKAAGRIKKTKSDRQKSRKDNSKCKVSGTKKCPTMKSRYKN